MEQNENNPTSGLKAIIDDMYEELDMERPPEPESDEDENDTGAFIFHSYLIQGSKGIRQWPTNKCTFPIITHKITIET